MTSFPRGAVALTFSLAATLLALPAPTSTAAYPEGAEPVLTGLELTHPRIHAVGAEHTGLPKKTRLKLTLNVAALVRVRVKDTNPYGIGRVFSTDLPAGASAITFSARVDGTKLPPGKYEVVVKAHNPDGSSKKVFLPLRIVGEK